MYVTSISHVISQTHARAVCIQELIIIIIMPAGYLNTSPPSLPPSMLPLLLKDGLLMPYAVTSLAFLVLSTHLLSALERCTEAQLRLEGYHRLAALLPACLPRLDLARIIRWKVRPGTNSRLLEVTLL